MVTTIGEAFKLIKSFKFLNGEGGQCDIQKLQKHNRHEVIEGI